ncbi:MAG TPA: PAS domain-containing protein, partial [Acetobacteraceae bacterium]|nr:PAS domain-containing protein [Acetobacteraceae bacterium]
MRLAFTAADLLLELGPDGTIRYATGAFNTHFGAPAPDFVGESINRLIAPADRAALAAGLAEAATRGRSLPIILHLANQARAPMVLAVLAVDGAGAGFSVTLGRVPASPNTVTDSLPDPASFALEAEMRLANGAPASLALLDLAGEGAAKPAGGDDEARQREIAAALAAAPELGADPLVAAHAPGRFGVISRDA